MNYWRMAMRWGRGGTDIFPFCKEKGIASLDYFDEQNKNQRVVEDCRHLSDEEFTSLWRERNPKNTSGRSSLRLFWKEMKRDDIIFAKTATNVVGRGTIIEEYMFDPNILAGTPGAKWAHYVKVDWDKNFVAFKFIFHAPQFTIRKLDGDELQRLLELYKQYN